ncbi:hypothetical protein HYW75_03195 [Candidatus Pacearchaeota archaeon]|nr:hypothetical protein [Candidatus Pacearchaeota archaeon]
MKWKRRGVSTVVATVLIVLLTLAAASFLAQFLVPYIKDNLTKSTECVDYRNYFVFKEKIGNSNFNCYTLNGNTKTKYGASISAIGNDSSLSIKGFDLVFIKGDGSTKPIRVINDAVGSKSNGGITTYDPSSNADPPSCLLNIKIPNAGETFTYIYTPDPSALENYVEMEIYPILKSDKVCGKSDKIELRNCLGEVGLQCKQ